MSSVFVHPWDKPFSAHEMLYSGPEIAERFGITKPSAYEWVNRWAAKNGEQPRMLVVLGSGAPVPLWSAEQVDRMEEAHRPTRQASTRRAATRRAWQNPLNSTTTGTF